MRFGLFGSASAARGGPTPTARAGLPRLRRAFNVEAEALGYHASFLVEHHFTGLRPGLRDAALCCTGSAARTTHAPPRHRGAGAALAQPGAAGRAGGDPRPALRRPARPRHRQGLPATPSSPASACRRDGGRRRASTRRSTCMLRAPGPPTSASPTTAASGSSRTSSSSRRRRSARTRRSGWRRASAASIRKRRRARLQPAARPVRLAGADRASASPPTAQAGGGARAGASTRMRVAVARNLLLADSAADQRRRPGAQQRQAHEA